jgi:hypothetical protein
MFEDAGHFHTILRGAERHLRVTSMQNRGGQLIVHTGEMNPLLSDHRQKRFARVKCVYKNG